MLMNYKSFNKIHLTKDLVHFDNFLVNSSTLKDSDDIYGVKDRKVLY